MAKEKASPAKEKAAPAKEKAAPAKEKKSGSKQVAKEAKGASVREIGVTTRLAELYKSAIIAALMKRFEYKSVMQVPRLEKISVNMGIGDATQDAKLLDVATKEIEQIT